MRMIRFFEEPLSTILMTPFTRSDFEVTDFTPRVDMKETEKEMTVSVELPGMDEKDVEVLVTNDFLTIKGEKKEETGENYSCTERRYGSFERVISLPDGIDKEKVDASFKKGVLHIRLGKMAEAIEEVRKISIH
jgi:HSP20 family protein